MFQFTFGDVGSGKSLRQADETIYLLNRAKKIYEKSLKKHKKDALYPIRKREVWCNFHISEKYRFKYKDFYRYWMHPLEMIFVDYPQNKIIRRDYDCVWDEIAVEIPSDKWKDTHPEIRRFFAQHRKRGVQIYANTQDYMMLDINARRMATSVFKCQKLIGSRDPSQTLNPIPFVWGVILIWQLDKQSIREDGQTEKHISLLPEFFWITKSAIAIYDTTEDIAQNTKNKLMHVNFGCDKCDFVKTEHIKI